MSEPILLDTNVFGEIGRDDGDPIVAEWLASINQSDIRVAALTWGELVYGVAKMAAGKRRASLSGWLELMMSIHIEATLPFDGNAAKIWGQLLAEQSKRGQSRPLIDLQIAAIALHHGLAVVTRNTKHFEGLGLTLINPWDLADSRRTQEQDTSS